MQPQDQLPPPEPEQPETPVTPPPSVPAPEEPPEEEPEQPAKPSKHEDAMLRMDPDEHQVAVIHRHIISIISMFVVVGAGLAIAIGFALFFLPSIVDRSTNPSLYMYVNVAVFLVVIIMLLVLAVAIFIYQQTRLIVTDKTITQVIQYSLFSRRISQLTIANIEDVNAAKNGFLQTVFNYGTLNMETAGEVENFNFPYCPNPDYYAKQILEARENFVRRRGYREPIPGRDYREPA